jgi:hypothetical protein
VSGKAWKSVVVWNMNFMTFHILGIIVIPTDEAIFLRGVGLNHQPEYLYGNINGNIVVGIFCLGNMGIS